MNKTMKACKPRLVGLKFAYYEFELNIFEIDPDNLDPDAIETHTVIAGLDIAAGRSGPIAASQVFTLQVKLVHEGITLLKPSTRQYVDVRMPERDAEFSLGQGAYDHVVERELSFRILSPLLNIIDSVGLDIVTATCNVRSLTTSPYRWVFGCGLPKQHDLRIISSSSDYATIQLKDSGEIDTDFFTVEVGAITDTDYGDGLLGRWLDELEGSEEEDEDLDTPKKDTT